jgi:two-component system alkaline phosphatase synthesis response regulator PhoP
MAKQQYVIVVADDNELIIDFLNDLLQEEGYQVLCCFSGEEALRVIGRVIPDVAILDMQMETHDAGLQVLEHVRQQPETARVSVIICSADVPFLEAKKKDITAYRGEIVYKPFEIPHLLATIEKVLMATP